MNNTTTIILVDVDDKVEKEVARREISIDAIALASIIRFQDDLYTFGYKVHGVNAYAFMKAVNVYTIES